MNEEQIVLTPAQLAQWTASAEYRAGYADGVFAIVSPDVDRIVLSQADGTVIATATRQTTWQIS